MENPCADPIYRLQAALVTTATAFSTNPILYFYTNETKYPSAICFQQ